MKGKKMIQNTLVEELFWYSLKIKILKTILFVYLIEKIKGSASECVLVSMLAARSLAIENFKKRYNNIQEDGHILTKLVAYTSLLVRNISF